VQVDRILADTWKLQVSNRAHSSPEASHTPRSSCLLHTKQRRDRIIKLHQSLKKLVFNHTIILNKQAREQQSQTLMSHNIPAACTLYQPGQQSNGSVEDPSYQNLQQASWTKLAAQTLSSQIYRLLRLFTTLPNRQTGVEQASLPTATTYIILPFRLSELQSPIFNLLRMLSNRVYIYLALSRPYLRHSKSMARLCRKSLRTLRHCSIATL
jgi:hypothetical protein